MTRGAAAAAGIHTRMHAQAARGGGRAVGAARYAHCMLVQSPSSCSAASWILSSNLSRIVPSFVAMVTCVASKR